MVVRAVRELSFLVGNGLILRVFRLKGRKGRELVKAAEELDVLDAAQRFAGRFEALFIRPRALAAHAVQNAADAEVNQSVGAAHDEGDAGGEDGVDRDHERDEAERHDAVGDHPHAGAEDVLDELVDLGEDAFGHVAAVAA